MFQLGEASAVRKPRRPPATLANQRCSGPGSPSRNGCGCSGLVAVDAQHGLKQPGRRVVDVEFTDSSSMASRPNRPGATRLERPSMTARYSGRAVRRARQAGFRRS